MNCRNRWQKVLLNIIFECLKCTDFVDHPNSQIWCKLRSGVKEILKKQNGIVLPNNLCSASLEQPVIWFVKFQPVSHTIKSTIIANAINYEMLGFEFFQSYVHLLWRCNISCIESRLRLYSSSQNYLDDVLEQNLRALIVSIGPVFTDVCILEDSDAFECISKQAYKVFSFLSVDTGKAL